MSIILQKATLADAKLIWQIQLKAFKELLDKYQDYNTNPGNDKIDKIIEQMNEENSTFYLIKDDEQVVGAIRAVEPKDKPYKKLGPVMVLPEYQGRGIAQQAIALIEDIYGSDYWTLVTILQEDKLCHLYEKMGYKKTDETLPLKDGMTLMAFMKNYQPGAETFKFGFGGR